MVLKTYQHFGSRAPIHVATPIITMSY